jgi:hypothetical protein
MLQTMKTNKENLRMKNSSLKRSEQETKKEETEETDREEQHKNINRQEKESVSVLVSCCYRYFYICSRGH